MKKKRFYWVLSILLACNGFICGASLTGMVVDSETKEPVFGVSLYYRDVAISFSDDNGRFFLQLDKLELQEAIVFRHISFHDKTVVISILQTDSVVEMENRFYSLSEVTVTPVDSKKLIQSIVAKYRQTAPMQPYWSKIHQTQTLTYMGELAGYVEYTGYMLCMGSDIKDPFIGNKWFPEHVRRIKENQRVSVIFGDEYRIRYSEISIEYLWDAYRFFDVMHPLGKFNKKYELRVDSLFTMEGKEFWALSYRQIGIISVAGWNYASNTGQMWIEKNTHSLVRLTGSCNRGVMYVTQFSIDYGTFDDKVAPYAMAISMIRNKTSRGARAQDKILCESRIYFSEADSRKGKKYQKEYRKYHYMHETVTIADFPYEPEYWKTFTAYNNMNFTEGANMPVYISPDDPLIQELLPYSQAANQYMKEEIQLLNWKTIQPFRALK